jgi:hypothetical protein
LATAGLFPFSSLSFKQNFVLEARQFPDAGNFHPTTHLHFSNPVTQPRRSVPNESLNYVIRFCTKVQL